MLEIKSFLTAFNNIFDLIRNKYVLKMGFFSECNNTIICNLAILKHKNMNFACQNYSLVNGKFNVCNTHKKENCAQDRAHVLDFYIIH